MAHVEKSRPDSGHGFHAKVLETFYVVPSSLGSRLSSLDYDFEVPFISLSLFLPPFQAFNIRDTSFSDDFQEMSASEWCFPHSSCLNFKCVNFFTLHPLFRRTFQRCPRRGWSPAGPTKSSTASRILSRSKPQNSRARDRLDGPEMA